MEFTPASLWFWEHALGFDGLLFAQGHGECTAQNLIDTVFQSCWNGMDDRAAALEKGNEGSEMEKGWKTTKEHRQ